MSGKTDDLKGRATEAAGDLSGDDDLQREGKADQTKGNVKEKVDDAKNCVEDKVDKVTDTTNNL